MEQSEIEQAVERISADSKAIENYVKARFEEANALRDELTKKTAELDNIRTQLTNSEEKAKAAQELLNQSYGIVIKEIFEEPTTKIIKRMSKESRNGTVITVAVAVISIVVSLAISSFFSMQSSKDLKKATEAFSGSAERNMKSLMEAIPGTYKEKALRNLLAEAKSMFNGYQSRNDLALVYKTRILSGAPPMRYKEVLCIMQEFCPPNALPSVQDLNTWCKDYALLLDNAVAVVSSEAKLRPKAHPTNTHRDVESFKSNDDQTLYDGWGKWSPELTYQDLLDGYVEERKQVQQHLSINAEETMPTKKRHKSIQ